MYIAEPSCSRGSRIYIRWNGWSIYFSQEYSVWRSVVLEDDINVFLSSTWMMSDSSKLDHKNHLKDFNEFNQGGIECSKHISTRIAGCQKCSRWEIFASHHVGQDTRSIYRSECGRTSLGLLRLVEISWWFSGNAIFFSFLIFFKFFCVSCAFLSKLMCIFCQYVHFFWHLWPDFQSHWLMRLLLTLVMLCKAQLKLKSVPVVKPVLILQQCTF